jgi:hypothetical protein
VRWHVVWHVAKKLLWHIFWNKYIYIHILTPILFWYLLWHFLWQIPCDIYPDTLSDIYSDFPAEFFLTLVLAHFLTCLTISDIYIYIYSDSLCHSRAQRAQLVTHSAWCTSCPRDPQKGTRSGATQRPCFEIAMTRVDNRRGWLAVTKSRPSLDKSGHTYQLSNKQKLKIWKW